MFGAALGGMLVAVFGLVGPAVALRELNGAVDWEFIAASFGIGTLVGGFVAMKINVKYPMRVGTLPVFFFCSVNRASCIC
ncbi:MAG: hypothetical protein ACI9CE_002210 [Flavobacterium sp.]